MYKLLLKSLWLSLIMLGLPSWCFAMSSIGDVSENIFGPVELFTKLALLACYIIGAMLIFASIAQYKIHRQSPKLVPLTTPIVLLILGIICVLIPYTSKMFGYTYSAVERAKVEGRHQNENLLPLPDVSRPGPLLPTAPRQVPVQQDIPEGNTNNAAEEPQNPSNSPSLPENSGGEHWTSDPRYNQ